ncbi:toll/interleukin-1 receptor domain-containing protein [Streptomyces sp. NPDC006208]|uniref:toll/interleukin-1 receptor domain-containing protein n=1 Tax=Streptomyces sp. NPDC006208 TaxID=3156734 RepID=UPI0033B14D3A
MVPQRVFISHSSQVEHFDWEVCLAVRQCLECAGYEVFLDRKSLRNQEGWEPQIRRNLASCDAAVFIIGRRALSSKWVRREAEILRQEHDVRGIFLVVVLLDGVSTSDLESAHLDVLNIKQVMRCDTKVRPTPSQLATRVAREFAKLPRLPGEDKPMQRWIERVSLMLRGCADRSALEQAARMLGLEEGEAQQAGGFNGERLLARRLLDAGLGETVPAAVGHLYAALGPAGGHLANQMAPTWVDATAARGLIPAEGTDEGRVILLNAYAKETAEHYIDRAMCKEASRYDKEITIALEGDETEAAAVFRGELEGALWKMAAASPGEKCAKPPGKDLYLVIPVARGARRRMLAAVIKEIRRDFPWLHVVAVLDGTAPDERLRAEWGLSDAIVASPVLGDEGERLGHFRVKNLFDAVETKYHMPRRGMG